MLLDALCFGGIALKEHVGNTGLSLFEDDVLKLLYVPASRGEDLEAVSEDANLVEMANLNLAQSRVVDAGSVDPVELVDDAFSIELLDHADSFLADSRLSLLSARTAVVCAVDAWVGSDRMVEVVRCLDSWLSVVHISANPEVRA